MNFYLLVQQRVNIDWFLLATCFIFHCRTCDLNRTGFLRQGCKGGQQKIVVKIHPRISTSKDPPTWTSKLTTKLNTNTKML